MHSKRIGVRQFLAFLLVLNITIEQNMVKTV